MNFESVNSSTVGAVAYDSESSTLGIRFKNSTEYHYFSVPDRIYRALVTATSIGQYFDRNIKKAGFRFKQIR